MAFRDRPAASTAVGYYLVLIAVTLLFAGPLAWMVLCSLKSPAELAENPYRLLPRDWRWRNYPEALAAIPFLTYLANTLILCIGSVAGTLFSCSLAAYGFSRIRWRGRDAVFFLLIATMLLPWHVTMLPRFLLLSRLGLYDSLAALIVPTFLGDAFYIFLLRQFFLRIPEELCEAGRLDGLSEWGVYWRIVMPLAKPALATVALFQFVAAWNDFSGPLLYLWSPDKFPLAYGLERFVSSYGDKTHLLLAAAVMFTAPIIVLFFFAQRAFLQGVAATGLKN
ncbi:carbohydrate ABC transporter permease [Lignipirellula cremea]|uniref:L-arabinose transport system permease protein AraQ n=1 Tax=Lignipirellula cremea TaxID=2528010 RepID=A0A518DT25_9BACT|nr:carbohydrate ABC transporter permease [Lignipirellula cremea]QDU94992.1 L-arabinose transport system permease protein AraQ [Lignipirellula cremea]